MKLCSVIVPVYNVEMYLPKCLNSIISQTYKYIEIILVDDGSTDKSGNICEEYAKKNNKIIVVHQSNKGLSAARNAGITVASGQYIVFVDSDDWLEKDAIEKLMQKVKKRDYDVVAHSTFKNVNGRDCLVFPLSKDDGEINVSKLRNYLYISCLLNQSSFPFLFPEELKHGPEMSYPVLKIINRKFLLDNKLLFPEKVRFCEDKIFELMLVSKLNSLYFFNVPLYHYFIRQGSLSNRNGEDKIKEYPNAFHSIQKTMNKIGIWKTHKLYFDINAYQSCWSAIEKSAMFIQSIKEVRDVAKKLNIFWDRMATRYAVSDKVTQMAKGKKYIFYSFCIKYKMFYLAVLVSYLYYRLYPERNTLRNKTKKYEN